MRTGIFGGTFDPAHLGHTSAAAAAQAQVALDRVLFIPAGDPWQKSDMYVSPARHRLEMTRLAIRGISGLALDRREIDRPGPTYTIDTLATFDSDEELFLIVGADVATGMPTWHRSREVVARATILVVPRGAVSQADVTRVLPEGVYLEMDPVDISAIEIRRMVRTGEPYRHLVNPEVFDYIERIGLYTDRYEDDRVGFPTDFEEQP